MLTDALGKNNSADALSHPLDYAKNVKLTNGVLVPPNTFQLLLMHWTPSLVELQSSSGAIPESSTCL